MDPWRTSPSLITIRRRFHSRVPKPRLNMLGKPNPIQILRVLEQTRRPPKSANLRQKSPVLMPPGLPLPQTLWARELDRPVSSGTPITNPCKMGSLITRLLLSADERHHLHPFVISTYDSHEILIPRLRSDVHELEPRLILMYFRSASLHGVTWNDFTTALAGLHLLSS